METTPKEALKFLKDNICEDVKLPNAEGMQNKTSFYMASEIMAAFCNQQSTSQKETIERLRELINWAINQDDFGSISGRAQFIRKANQALSSEELDEQQIEDRRIEELTERNVKIVGDFMEHCESEGFVIPDHLYESYFNA